MPEGVVVALEAVEVVDREEPRLVNRRGGHRVVEVAHQPATVAQTGERVRDRLVGRLPKEAPILPEGEPEAGEHTGERQCGECDREQVEPLEVIDDEQRDRDESAHRRHGEQRPSANVDHPLAVVVLPCGDGDQEQAGRPRRVEEPSLLVAAGRGRVEIGAVGEGADRRAMHRGAPRLGRAASG